MRTLCVSIITVALLAGSAIGVVGQEDGAELIEVAAPVEVTGTYRQGSCGYGSGPDEEVGDVVRSRGFNCGLDWSMSDPQLEGTVTWVLNWDSYLDRADLWVGAVTIENDAGAWRERPAPWLRFNTSVEAATRTMVLDGEDGYEGLFAVLEVTMREDGEWLDPRTLHGLIVEGEPPPPPGNASTK
jgi:hypothetical protein